MKGRISKDLRTILQDPSAREQLSRHLQTGRDGTISVGQQAFSLRTNVVTAKQATPHASSRPRKPGR